MQTPAIDLFNAAVCAHQAGDLETAERNYRQFLWQTEKHADGWHMLGLLLAQKKAYEEAEQCLHKAIRLNPRSASFHHNAGENYRRWGKSDAAKQAYQTALQLDPNHAEARFCLANLCKQNGEHEAALSGYRRVVESNPAHHRAWFNLGNTLQEIGQTDEAIHAYRSCLAINPKFDDAWVNLGRSLVERNETMPAIDAYQQVLNRQPQRTELYGNLAIAHLKCGQFSAAKEMYQAKLKAQHSWLKSFRLHTMMLPLLSSNAEIDVARDNLNRMLDESLAEQRNIDITELHSSGIEPPMALAYHGRDDLALKRKYAQLFVDQIPEGSCKINRGVPRVGFVVTHGHEGVFAKCMRGAIEHLPRDRFKVSIVCSPSSRGYLRQQVQANDVDFVLLPDRLDQAAEVLKEANFDVLLYWEIGTDSTNYFLPFFRLAPVQCTTFGWPVTTGIPTVDYLLSSQLLETAEADEHYSEKLVRLDALPTYYYRPTSPVMKTRADFDLPDKAHLYFCQQRLRKFQPDFDELVAGILRSDPQGLFVYLSDREQYMAHLFEARLQATAPDVMHQVRQLPWMEFGDYLNITALSDVVLDTPHYGGGANTVYDALSMGTPIVTLAGQFQRSRYTLGSYHKLEIAGPVATTAEQYIHMAVSLGTEPDKRGQLSKQILTRCSDLFEDRHYISEMTEAFESAIAPT